MADLGGKVNLASKLERLCMHHNGLVLYAAGAPRYEANFTRDAIISAELFANTLMLHDQLVFNAQRQGAEFNPRDGQEPGKAHHELILATGSGVTIDHIPGMEDRKKVITTFNACDSTAHFLIGHDALYNLTGSNLLAVQQKKNILEAVQYIMRHVNKNGLFFDAPPEGAERYALRATYWKDSTPPGKNDADYPISFTLPHVQNMAGLKAGLKMLRLMHGELTSEEREVARKVSDTIPRMREALNEQLWDAEYKTFIIGKDETTTIRGISSDSLYAAAYLEPTDVPKDRMNTVVKTSRALETPIGYRGLSEADTQRARKAAQDAGTVFDDYHTDPVWVVEQGKIHQGARRFGLDRAAEVSSRILKMAAQEEPNGTDFEIFRRKGRKWVGDGQPYQLWSIATKVYFSRNP
jgi:glycogen debranching enzyme